MKKEKRRKRRDGGRRGGLSPPEGKYSVEMLPPLDTVAAAGTETKDLKHPLS